MLKIIKVILDFISKLKLKCRSSCCSCSCSTAIEPTIEFDSDSF